MAYLVPPFSGKRYSENARKCRDGMVPCAICGRGVREVPSTVFAVVVAGGAEWGDERSDTSDPGHMGAFPIGPDCHQRYAVRGQ